MRTKQLTISSDAFVHGGMIPENYGCHGQGDNPPLRIEGLPEETVTLALIAEDPDAPKGVFDHWLVWNIDPVTHIDSGKNPGISGTNSAGKTGYHPPCPPTGSHRYYFYVFALDTALELPAGAGREELEDAISQHIIAQGHIMGHYKHAKD